MIESTLKAAPATFIKMVALKSAALWTLQVNLCCLSSLH